MSGSVQEKALFLYKTRDKTCKRDLPIGETVGWTVSTYKHVIDPTPRLQNNSQTLENIDGLCLHTATHSKRQNTATSISTETVS